MADPDTTEIAHRAINALLGLVLNTYKITLTATLTVVLGLILLFALGYIIALICYFDFKKRTFRFFPREEAYAAGLFCLLPILFAGFFVWHWNDEFLGTPNPPIWIFELWMAAIAFTVLLTVSSIAIPILLLANALEPFLFPASGAKTNSETRTGEPEKVTTESKNPEGAINESKTAEQDESKKTA